MKARNLFVTLVVISLFGCATLPVAQIRLPNGHLCPSEWKNELVIHHISVGQGDSTFIRTPGGTTVLVDAGLPGKGKADVVPTLKSCYGVSSLDYVVLTHFDQDHHGGMPYVLNNLPVNRAVFDPGDAMSTKSRSPRSRFSKYKRAADATNKRRVPKLGSKTIVTSDDVAFTVVAINGEVLGGNHVNVFKKNGKPKDANAMSIALKIKLGNFDYLVAGDLTGGGNGKPDVETPVSEKVGDLDILRANHHGSHTSNNETFLKRLSPEIVLISVGNGGLNRRYKLPSEKVMERLAKLASIKTIYQTSKGEGRAPTSNLKKVINMDGDIIVLAGTNGFSVGKTRYATDGK